LEAPHSALWLLATIAVQAQKHSFFTPKISLWSLGEGNLIDNTRMTFENEFLVFHDLLNSIYKERV
jgi:hypothetical protein